MCSNNLFPIVGGRVLKCCFVSAVTQLMYDAQSLHFFILVVVDRHSWSIYKCIITVVLEGGLSASATGV